MLWIVEYDNGYIGTENNTILLLDKCTRYFKKEENAIKFYNQKKYQLSQINKQGFENIFYYYEEFDDENINS